jgi:hypothetical protein
MNRQEKFHIFQGIGDLALREGARAPVGKGMGLREPGAVEPLNQVCIGDLSPIPDHCCGNLRIEERLGDLPGMCGKQVEILPSSMEYLFDFGVTDQLPEDIERSNRLHGREIDDSRGSRGGDLN